MGTWCRRDDHDAEEFGRQYWLQKL